MLGVSDLLIYSIQGCIFPSSQNLSCGLEAPSALPSLESVTNSAPLDVLRTALEEYEQHVNVPMTHLVYWKPKLILQVLNAPSVMSVSFVPLNCTDDSILFIQKGIMEEGITGFFAPYLVEEEQQQLWNAKPELPDIHRIQSEESLVQSLTGLEEEVFQDIQACLKYFLLDKCTQAIAITYKTSTGISSRSWIKV